MHDYTANEAGHWKPECEFCGKASGTPQNHEYVEKIDDAGDAWVYAFRCTICKYIAYEQYVPYEINSFYSAGELSGIDTDKTFTGSFSFEAGTGYAAYTMSGGGAGTVKIVDSEDMDMESGRYLVFKVRLPASRTSFTISIRSVCADKSYSMAFNDLLPGWTTVVADMTKAVTVNSDGTVSGYQIDENEEYYLAYLGMNGRVNSGESFDVAYVMMCDTLAEAQDFVKGEKQIYTYHDIANEPPEVVKLPCVDKDGNEIVHTFTSDENGHTVPEGCDQCGLRAVSNEPHTYTQMRVNGEMTYACSVCEYLQYGYYLNKLISAQEINNNALVYYKVDRPKEPISEDGVDFARFTGRGATAQVIFARNNWATTGGSPDAMNQIAAAFPVGRADLLVVRMRTNDPTAKIRMMLGGIAGKEKEVIFPTSLATVVSEPDAETVEYGWTTYVIDLPRAIPSVYVPDEKGEYTLHNFYFQMGSGSDGADYTADVHYDIDFMAFVDSWEELKQIVVDETVVKVNASDDGTLVKTQEQECVGEHSWGENVDGTTYSYLCVNCGTPLKTVTLGESVTKYISGFEVGRNATVYAAAPGYVGEKSVGLDGEDTVFGRLNIYSEIWWLRHQRDYHHGATGASLNNKEINIGKAKYFVVRMRNTDNQKNVEFYMSTSGKNGEGYSVAPDGTETKPTSSGTILISSPANAATAGQWTTFVFDLEALIPEYYVADPETGDYLIDTFGMARSRDGNVTDIEFMAFVEGGWEEIDALTPDETVIYATHYKNKTYSIMDVKTGKCANDQHSYLYEGEMQEDGSTLYSYACGGCGDCLYTKSVPASVTKFFSGNDVAFGATTYAAGSGTKEIGVGEDGVFYGRVADHAEIWWMRHQQDFNGQTGGQLDNKFIEVGEAKYFVVRLRSSDISKGFEFYISTTGKNGTPRTEDEVTETRPLEIPTTNGYTSISTPVQQAAKADEWTTYVFNLEEIYADYYVKDPETNEYILDTFAITYAQGYNADVEFMAFVDGDWSDIDALVSDETVVYVTHSKDKTFEVRDTATGETVASAE